MKFVVSVRFFFPIATLSFARIRSVCKNYIRGNVSKCVVLYRGRVCRRGVLIILLRSSIFKR